MDPAGFEGRGGALVEEAKRLMQNDEEDEAPKAGAEGPKIKMNKIGRLGKKGAPAKASATGNTTANNAWKETADKIISNPGQFTE